MAAALKDIYSVSFYEQFCTALQASIPKFSSKRFMARIFVEEFEGYELKQRLKHTSMVLTEFLPSDYKQANKILMKIIDNLRSNGIEENNFEYLFLPEYIELNGLDDYKESVKILEFVTQFTSCEFAVRPFILKYQEKMYKQMLSWSDHPHYLVRRLSTEGFRPRLPWGMGLPMLKEDPSPILPVLENLKNDESDNVRRSVANNLNDISKDNPEIVLEIANHWIGESEHVDALLKHACRTLLKAGDQQALELFGLSNKYFSVSDFKVSTPEVSIGGDLFFSFSVTNSSKEARIARLEYGVYYLRKNGELNRKVFKISEKPIDSATTIEVERKQSFKLITTRKFYPGEHMLSVIVNGQETELLPFMLRED